MWEFFSLVFQKFFGLFSKKKKWQKKVESRLDKIDAVMRISMGRDLVVDLKKYLEKKYISQREYEEVEKMIKAYEAIGGDGYVHDLWDRIREECVGRTLELEGGVNECQNSTQTETTTD